MDYFVLVVDEFDDNYNIEKNFYTTLRDSKSVLALTSLSTGPFQKTYFDSLKLYDSHLPFLLLLKHSTNTTHTITNLNSSTPFTDILSQPPHRPTSTD